MRTIVLTRPVPEAQHWQQQLATLGLTTEVFPLLEIAPLHDAATMASLQHITQQLHQYRAVMFVSSNAVRHFLQYPGMLAAMEHAVSQGTRAWAPGPGTTLVLRQAHWPSAAIDSPPSQAAQFDSEALWTTVAPQIHDRDRVLIVRGASAAQPPGAQGSGREWLAAQLRAAGAEVDLLGVYRRQCPQNTAALYTQIERLCHSSVVWLFSSSEAIDHLRQLAPLQEWHRQRALATHPRIAQTARAAGFGEVRECKPGVLDVHASIESWT